MRSPPEELYLPAPGSNGSCYHAKICGAHMLEAVPFHEAAARIRREGLEPCSVCVEHHGLNVFFNQ